MRQFHVPQFIDIEDKIFGPLTVRQFIYLGGGTAVIVIFYFTLPFFLVVPLGVPVVVFASALAFYKIHAQPLVRVIGNIVTYMFRKKLYVWKKIETKKGEALAERARAASFEIPRSSRAKLKDLSWGLDVKERLK